MIMSSHRRRYGGHRLEIVRAPVPRLPREDLRSDDGDTDERWASAVMLSYLSLVLVVAVALVYSWSAGSRVSASQGTGEPSSYHLAR
jgi:hypothetical protein